ncbi:major facilitator superfamily domain-containing protein [Rhodofomes roseus]|uniref:Major facilitator superfamily domain-containing protein n=1 Tax=Rhodofomes roseus TaxID=34475 RepID=A0ABQ8KG15_9APHY|nr:major facilitator superfamily domain-containing protein [Rhodofomes roseus]KAH9836724.1 major facilitator superfamily domain-containing protein [Rhodofomes roseus]
MALQLKDLPFRRDDDQTLHSDVPTVVTDEHPQLYNSTSAAAHQVNLEDDQPQPIRKGTTFWMILSALIISFFMVVLEGASVGNASPTIAGDLSITQFAWIGTAYGLSSTALLPLSGGLAQIFGRRPVMLVSLTIFAVGGALSGASRGTATLFAGRTIQGLGGGGVLTLSSIILSDLVALHERGLYNGLFSLAWTAASGVGPVIGGSFAQSGHWRWLFYMNVPFAGCAAAFVFFFVRLPTPPGSLRSKLKQIDWIGNALVMGSTVALVIGLTWGGVEYPWLSAQVLVPLIVGGIGMAIFMLYETLLATHPLVPVRLIYNRTSISGLVQTGLLSVPLTGLMYYLPVYYQACTLASPIRAGTLVFGVAFTVAPTTLVAGALITATKRYRPPIWFGWVLLLIGQGLLTTLKATSAKATSIGFQILIGVGIGAVYSSTYFPVLAPLPVEQNAPALALYVFLRSFAQIWGVAIGATVLQNQLSSRLPQAFLETLPSGASVAYSAIPAIPALASPLREEVQVAFAESLDVLWRVLCALSAVGAFASLWMKGLSLHTDTDRRWDVNKAEGEGEK